VREASWCFDDSSFGPFTNSGCTFETVSPLRGTASAKFSCNAIQTFYWTFNPIRPVLYWAARWKFSSPSVGCGLVQWTGTNGTILDLRLNGSGLIELRKNAILQATSRRAITTDQEFHLQGELFFTSFLIARTRFDNIALFDLNFGPVALTPAEVIAEMRFGSFLGTGSGTGVVDDVVINNSDQFSRKDYNYPGNWTGRIDRPNAAGTFAEWSGVVGNVNDANDATLISGNDNGQKVAYSFPLATLPAERTVMKAATYLVRAKSENPENLRIGIHKNQLTPINEKWRVFFDGVPTGGTLQVGFNDALTAEIAFDASAATFQAAIEALDDIKAGNVTVTGNNSVGWTMEFIGRLAAEAMPPFTAGGSGFGSGVTIHIERIQVGNENFFHPPIGELWWFSSAYAQPVLTTVLSNHFYHSLLKPDTQSLWNRTTLAEFQILLECFNPSF